MMFVLLVAIYRKVTPAFATKIIPGVFLVTMFSARFLLEYTKTRQEAYEISLPFSTGQLLSVPYIIVGILWIIWAFKSASKDTENDKASHN
jgi:prolipoprotein diacylglyceryltransferase